MKVEPTMDHEPIDIIHLSRTLTEVLDFCYRELPLKALHGALERSERLHGRECYIARDLRREIARRRRREAKS